MQLRQENLRADSFNLVGFQNHLKFGEQARILRMIPGLEKAEFLRFGQIHRNTYINAPALLTPTLQLRVASGDLFRRPDLGRRRLRGVDRDRADGGDARGGARARRRAARRLPRETALGSLCHYVSGADPTHYQPANITFDLLPQLDEATRHQLRHDKKARHAEVCRRAQDALERVPARPCLSSAQQIERYLQELARGGRFAAHGRRIRRAICAQFAGVPLAARTAPPEPRGHRPAACCASGWPACIAQDLDAVSIRRKLAAVRGLFRYLLREGVVAINRGAAGAHAEGAEEAARGDDRRAGEHAARRRRRGQAGAAVSRRATAPSSSCSTAAACASANWPGSNLEDIDRARALAAGARQGTQGAAGAAAAARRRRRWSAISASGRWCATSARCS